VGGTFVAGIAFYLWLALFLLASGVEPNPGPLAVQRARTQQLLDEEDVPVLLKLTLERSGRAVKDYDNCSYDHKMKLRRQLTTFFLQVRAGNFSGVKKWDAVSCVDPAVLRKYKLEGLLSASCLQQQSPAGSPQIVPVQQLVSSPPTHVQHVPLVSSLPSPKSSAARNLPPAVQECQQVFERDVRTESPDVDPTPARVFAALEDDEEDDFDAEPLPEGAANFRSSTPVSQDSPPDLAFLQELNLPQAEQPTLREVLRCWVVHTNTAHQHVDLLLRLLRQAGVTGLPLTTATLLRHKELTATKKRLRSSERTILEKRTKAGGKIVENPKEIGKFVYFGLKDGILNRSPGKKNPLIVLSLNSGSRVM
jgi:hypothetical protein